MAVIGSAETAAAIGWAKANTTLEEDADGYIREKLSGHIETLHRRLGHHANHQPVHFALTLKTGGPVEIELGPGSVQIHDPTGANPPEEIHASPAASQGEAVAVAQSPEAAAPPPLGPPLPSPEPSSAATAGTG